MKKEIEIKLEKLKKPKKYNLKQFWRYENGKKILIVKKQK